MFEVIFQVQVAEETVAHVRRDISRLAGGGTVEMNGLSQRVHHDVAILALVNVPLDFLAQLFAERSVHIV